MSENWTEVDLTPKQPAEASEEDNFEIEITEDESQEEKEPKENLEASETEEEDTPKDKSNEDTEMSDDARRKPKRRKSRAQDRIKGLVAERDVERRRAEELEARLAKIEEDREKEKRQQLSARKQSAEALLESAQTELAQAYEAADPQAIAKATAKVSKYSTEQVAFSEFGDEDTDTSKYVEEVPKEPTAPQSDVPEALTDWTTENDWFLNPENRAERRLRRYADKVSQELIDEGYTLDDDDLYDELDSKIAAFVKDKELDIDGFETVVKKEKRTERQTESPVQGSKGNTSKKKAIRLSREDVDMAERMGVTLEQYAAQLKREEENKDNQGAWTPITVG